MKFFAIVHVDDSTVIDPPIDSLEALHDELSGDGRPEDCVEVVGRTGRSLTLERRRVLILESYRHLSQTFHIQNASKQRDLNVWKLLASGDHEAIDRRPWRRGYPPPVIVNTRSSSAAFIKRGEAVYQVVGRYLNLPSFSEFELTHLLVNDAEQMLRAWERIADSFKAYTTRHSLTEPQEELLLHHLRELAVDEAHTLATGHGYWDELATIWQASDQNVPPMRKSAVQPQPNVTDP